MTLPTGTVTFLFAGIEGSAELAQQLGRRFDEVAREVSHILGEALSRFDGYQMPTEGDSYFAGRRLRERPAGRLLQTQDSRNQPGGAPAHGGK